MMQIVQIPVLNDNYQYLIICNETRQSVAVDAPDAEALKKALKEHEVQLIGIWNTHHHWDHIGGNEELVETFDVPVFCSAYDFENNRVPRATKGLREDDVVQVGNLQFKVLEIPGHTLGHIAFYGHGIVICGDTLFAGGCGRLFEGSPEQMYHSLAKLTKLPDDTLVYCMHEYTLNNLRFAQTLEPKNKNLFAKLSQVELKREQNQSTVPTTLLEEKSYNPFLRTDSLEILQNLREKGFSELNTPIAIFAAIRKLKDEF